MIGYLWFHLKNYRTLRVPPGFFLDAGPLINLNFKRIGTEPGSLLISRRLSHECSPVSVYDLNFKTPKSGHRDLQLHRESSIIDPISDHQVEVLADDSQRYP